jgi:hypothetical protein
MNRNAYIGRNVEILFKNSIEDNPSVIAKIQGYFGINSRFLNAVSTGIHAEKVDVKMEFADGHNIDANIKAFKKTVAYNQLTRTSIANFCKLFFNETMQTELEKLFIAKARNKGIQLFPRITQVRIGSAIQEKVDKILEWAFSYKQSREILVLYERTTSMMYIYPIKEVFKKLDKTISFTTKGNIAIGNTVVLQRKGGNGVHSLDIPKDSLRHPGNNVQLKLKMNEFTRVMKEVLLASYHI